ncbi:MAG: thrombospondin type 3 repeat-containing protein [Bdellovibrionales bacterium]|nr:thrombospondin type 3 repeat-containing protein [Bdellovibrionales bacterium]
MTLPKHSLLSVPMAFVLILSMAMLLSANAVHAENLSLTWNEVTMNEDGTPLNDLRNYVIRSGIASQSYSQVEDAGLSTEYNLILPDDGRTYYIVVTAVDLSGNESGNSNELVYTTRLLDQDGDGTPDSVDGCDFDPNKTQPGQCGCGIPDFDSDGDGTADCLDSCESDPNKTSPGSCGCGVADTDSDGDGTPNCLDMCSNDPSKVFPGVCGCGIADTDSDNDGIPNCLDQCAGTNDALDSDGDGVPNCQDQCSADPTKTTPGACGCGNADVDTDGDGTPDCQDGCSNDPAKTAPGFCGCGVADVNPTTGEPVTSPAECVVNQQELLIGVNDTEARRFIEDDQVPAGVIFHGNTIGIIEDTVNRMIWANNTLNLEEQSGVLLGFRVTVIDESRAGAGLFFSFQDPEGDNEGPERDLYALRVRAFSGGTIAPAHIGMTTSDGPGCLNDLGISFSSESPTHLYMILERRQGNSYRLRLIAQQLGSAPVLSTCDLETPYELRGFGIWSMNGAQGILFDSPIVFDFAAPELQASVTEGALDIAENQSTSLSVSLLESDGSRVLLNDETHDPNLILRVEPEGAAVIEGNTLLALEPGLLTVNIEYRSEDLSSTKTQLQMEVSGSKRIKHR